MTKSFSHICTFCIVSLGITGCSEPEATVPDIPAFIVQVDLPERVYVNVITTYAPSPEANCEFTGNETRRYRTGQSEFSNARQQASFVTPFSPLIDGCPSIPVQIRFEIIGRWGDRFIAGTYSQVGLQHGVIHVVEQLKENYLGMPDTGTREFFGVCKYKFRTRLEMHELIKVLKCNGVTDDGEVKEGYLVSGAVRRDQLLDNTIRLRIDLLDEEEPLNPRQWVKFPAGWKRCLGQGLDDLVGFCSKNNPRFRTFIMEERECTVYPGCTE